MVSFVICGYPGKGKSTSIFPNEELGIKGLDPEKMVYITCSSVKRGLLPNWREIFKADKKISEGGQYIATKEPAVIEKVILHVATSRPEIKFVVIEDANLIMGKHVMSKSKMERDEWSQLGTSMYRIFNTLDVISSDPKLNRDDLFIIFTLHLTHTDFTDGEMLRTKHEFALAGKMLSKNVPLESLWDIIVVADTKTTMTGDVEYVFQTKPKGNTPARSPHGLLPPEMKNDAGLIVDLICKYDGISLT
jgi:hypothetical protein